MVAASGFRKCSIYYVCLRNMGGFGVGVTAGPQHGHEDIGFPHFARLGIGDRHRLAGMIDEDLLAGPVFLAQHDIQIARPTPVQLAEPAIVVTFRMGLMVFFPQQL